MKDLTNYNFSDENGVDVTVLGVVNDWCVCEDIEHEEPYLLPLEFIQAIYNESNSGTAVAGQESVSPANGDLLADDAKKLKLICPIHGEQDFETLYIVGIKLKCGCCWDSFDKKGLVYKIQKGKVW